MSSKKLMPVLFSVLIFTLLVSVVSLTAVASVSDNSIEYTDTIVEDIPLDDRYYQEYINQYIEQYKRQYEEQYLQQYNESVNSIAESGLELIDSEDEFSIYNSVDFNSIEQEVVEESSTIVPCTYEEREMMYYLVEVEAHGGSHRHKNIIASVIVNRLLEPMFECDSLKDVMTQRGQFTSLQNYYQHWKGFTPTEDTKDAVDEVLDSIVDISIANGAVYFYNPSINGKMSFFESKTVALELEGHKFFKVR